MDTKIQELTDKIYKEGVEKGNEEAGTFCMKAVSETIAFTFEEVIFPVIRFTTSLFSASTAWVANTTV